MKKWIVSLLLAFPLLGAAQPAGFTEFFNKYSGKENYTTVEITRDMLQLIGGMSPDVKNDPGLMKLLSDIGTIRIVIASKPSDAFRNDMNLLSGMKDYRLLTAVSEGGQSTKFYFMDAASQKNVRRPYESRFLMLSQGAGECVVIHIVGGIDLKSVGNLSRINIGGMDKLDAMKEKRKD